MSYFFNCYTPDELKAEYRRLSKMLHPDKGGTAAEFRVMQDRYEDHKTYIERQEKWNTMPDLFSENGVYEYFRKRVRYVGVVYDHYYKFVQVAGADVLIDAEHIRLIFQHKNRI